MVAVQALQHRAISLEKFLADCFQGIHFARIDDGYGGTAVAARLAVIKLEVVPAYSHRIRRFGKQAAGYVLIIETVDQHLGRRQSHDIRFLLEGMGHFHAAGKAGVYQAVVQVHRDGIGKVFQLHFNTADRQSVLADGAEAPRRILRLESGRIRVIPGRQPAGGMGGKNHAVTLRKEILFREKQGLANGFLVTQRRVGRPCHQRVPPYVSVARGPKTIQHGGTGRGIIAPAFRQARQNQKYIGIHVGSFRDITAFEVCQVLRQIAGKRIVSGGNHHHYPAGRHRITALGKVCTRVRIFAAEPRLKSRVLVACRH